MRKRFEEDDILAKWEQTSWAKKMAMRRKRALLSDFDRFKLKVLKQQVRAREEGGILAVCSVYSTNSSRVLMKYILLSPSHPLFVLPLSPQKSRMVRGKFKQLKKEQKA